ncbi:glycine-rich protein DC7.1-like [Rhododendron vialii]|uniref:glycine-rich protein DC7.1-like n=1 Tax=Rhododendron vialii TaxID=182163 RepID=UPI00265F6EE4|nr:glycine-rich protein DC7.1-like [Rhododendron vialii]
MGSKTIVFLGLLVAIVLLITSEVTARDLVETYKETNAEQINGVENAGGGGHPGGKFGGNQGRAHGGGPDGGYGGGHGDRYGKTWDNGGGDWGPCCR